MASIKYKQNQCDTLMVVLQESAQGCPDVCIQLYRVSVLHMPDSPMYH